MVDVAQKLREYIDSHPFDAGTGNYQSVLEQLYQAYSDSHESDPPEIREVFTQLGDFLETLPMEDNNNLFNLICQLCIAFDQKAYIDGLQTGAHLISELYADKKGDTL